MLTFYKDPDFSKYIHKEYYDIHCVRTYVYQQNQTVTNYTEPIKLHRHEYLQTMFKFKNLTADKINQLTIDLEISLEIILKNQSTKFKI